jgi:hypothetical protein
MNLTRILLLTLVSVTFMGSCKSAKRSASLDAGIKSAELVNLHKSTEPRFTTLASRVNVNYDDGSRSQSITVSLRIQKDEMIWVSASILGISIARLLITTDNVSYYETINRTYFDGDFSLLSSWLGVDVDFQMVQNILMGQAVLPISSDKYDASVFGSNYRLTPKTQHELFKHIFLVNPGNNRMASQQIVQEEEQRVLTVDYASYQNVGLFLFPKEIRLNAIEQKDQTRVILDFRTVDVNPVVTFPFRIPGGYDQIRLD